MDFKLSPEDESFRHELREFVATEVPDNFEGRGRWPEEFDWDLTREMRKKLAARGWLTMHWPEEYGGQKASPVRSAVFNEEMAYPAGPRAGYLRGSNAGAHPDDPWHGGTAADPPDSRSPR